MAHSKPVNPRRLSFAAAQVVNTVTGTIQSSRQRSVMRAGIDVFQNEAIDTGDNSASRVVFQDRTELSIGPTSEVVLDRFVFDPNPSNSAVAVSVAKGVARFSTGLLPKPDYLIRTPSCTIGVRGTILQSAVFRRQRQLHVNFLQFEVGKGALRGDQRLRRCGAPAVYPRRPAGGLYPRTSRRTSLYPRHP